MSLPRVEEILRLTSPLAGSVKRILDLGCSDGGITLLVKERLNAEEAYGVDIDEKAVLAARNRGIYSYRLDLNREKLPFPDEFFDLVLALEVIEHLVNPDNMLREARRVLRKKGYLVISTPNLASWINRIILLLGYQPYNVEVSTEGVFGVPYTKGVFGRPSGHIRPFTLRALKQLLEYHGFQVLKITGAHDIHPENKLFRLIDRLFSLNPSMARRLIVMAVKS